MTPIHQTVFTAPGGNCFQACVASVLDMPLGDAFDFYATGESGQWMRHFAEWLEARGLAVAHFDLAKTGTTMCGLCILGVRTDPPANPARPEWMHAVVGRLDRRPAPDNMMDVTVVHDPNPDGRPIVEVIDAMFLVRTLRQS